VFFGGLLRKNGSNSVSFAGNLALSAGFFS